MTKKQIKKHNDLLDLKKELSIVVMTGSFMQQYTNDYPDHLKSEIKFIARVIFCYQKHLKEVIKIAEKTFETIELSQRNSKPQKFKPVCQFDDNGDLCVSLISLVVNLLDIHKTIRGRKIILDRSLYAISDGHRDKEEVRNARIVAGKFYDSISRYYDLQKK